MRHRKSINHLSRTASHRKAMLANMAASLILHKRIKTTTAKAKALRTFVEPIITKSKDDSTHSRRVIFSYLQDKEAVSELFREISPKIADRPGGYTRILKTGSRLGDNADMCIIELVDYNENLLAAKDESASRATRRRRRGGKKKAGEQPDAPAAIEASTEAAESIDAAEETIAESTADAQAETAEEMAPEAEEEVKAGETTAGEEDIQAISGAEEEQEAEEAKEHEVEAVEEAREEKEEEIKAEAEDAEEGMEKPADEKKDTDHKKAE